MRVFAAASALCLVLTGAPSFAQAPAQPAPRPAAPATQTPRPAAPAGQGQQPARPAPSTTTPAQAAPTPPQPRFQDGLKYAFVNIQQVAAFSAEGKALADRSKSLQDSKVQELNNKNKALQAAQQKLEQGGSVLNDAARTQLQADIDRQQRDLQRAQEDAQQDVQNMLQQLQDEFMRKLAPVIDQVAKAKQIHMVFSAADAGLIWADPGMDLTGDVIKAFDASRTAAPAAPAPAPGK